MGFPENRTTPARSEADQARADIETIRLVRRGDSAAKRALGERLLCVPRMVVAINRRRGTPLDSETIRDVAQDAIVRIWHKLESFTGEGVFESWAYQFCHFEFMNQVRRRSRRRDTTSVESFDGVETTETEVVDQSFEEVESAIDELGPPESTIIRLRHEDDRSFPDIGSLVGLNPNTTKTRYYRGLARLRRRLSRYLDGTQSGGKPS